MRPLPGRHRAGRAACVTKSNREAGHSTTVRLECPSCGASIDSAKKPALSLFERAQRVEGQDASGWILYRIAKDSEHGSPRVARAHAA
jgi:hypothetical protein